MGQTIKKKNRINFRRRQDLIFYISLFILPCIQFTIFYIGVNMNSILLAFKNYQMQTDGLVSSFAGFDNFAAAIKLIKENVYIFKYTFIAYGTNTFIGMSLGLIFSFYIYKKMPASGVFKVILFLPAVISGLVFSLLFNYITSDVYITIVQKITGKTDVVGLLYNRDTRLATVLFFCVWSGFGMNILLFSGTMSGIDESIVESAQLDGAGLVKEFLYITFPLIYPTFLQMIVVGFSGIFAHNMGLMGLYGLMASETSELATFGMFLYINTQKAGLVMKNGLSIGVLSSMGIMLTCVLLPITLVLRKLLSKYGPSVD